MRTAIYARVSTDKQELDNQLNELKSFCNRSGWTIYQEYTDIITGKETSRPAYDRLFEDAYKKQFDMVVFWDLTRFSRAGALLTLQKLHELDVLGIAWKSYQEQYLDSAGAFKDVVISIMATLAKLEREKISERTKAGLRGKANVGKRGKDKKPRKNIGYLLRYMTPKQKEKFKEKTAQTK